MNESVEWQAGKSVDYKDGRKWGSVYWIKGGCKPPLCTYPSTLLIVAIASLLEQRSPTDGHALRL
jgi:hypothetical protein